MSLLEKAIQLAVKAHAGQMDEDGYPHIVHCFGVFHQVQVMFKEREARVTPPIEKYTQDEILLAAILHDTVEDTFVTLDMIEQEFGKNVRDIVDSVTRRGTKEGETKEFYRDFIYRAKSNEGGLVVKIADLIHNFGRSNKIKKASWQNKLQFKYGIALSVLNDVDQPTWEQASASVTQDDTTHYFIADPNGKKTEVTEQEFRAMDAAKPRC